MRMVSEIFKNLCCKGKGQSLVCIDAAVPPSKGMLELTFDVRYEFLKLCLSIGF